MHLTFPLWCVISKETDDSENKFLPACTGPAREQGSPAQAFFISVNKRESAVLLLQKQRYSLKAGWLSVLEDIGYMIKCQVLKSLEGGENNEQSYF